VVDHGRAEGLLHLAERLREQGDLRAELTPPEAADLLWVITSFDTFDQLYTGRGLTREQVGDRLVALAEHSLFR
jgi:hypothetical protein